MKDNMPENQAIKGLKHQFKEETKRAINKKLLPKEEVKPIDGTEYVEAFNGLETSLLTPDLLSDAILYFQRNWNAVKAQYLPGDKACLTAIPVSDMGVELDEKTIKKHQYLHLLSVSGTDGLTREFSFYAAHYFELMPETIQKDVSQGGCTFTVEKDEAGSYGKSQAAFIRDYRLAFNNLRKFFDLPPLEDVLN